MAHPTTSSAYGIWSLNEVRDAVRGDNWPELPFTITSLGTTVTQSSNDVTGIDLSSVSEGDQLVLVYGSEGAGDVTSATLAGTSVTVDLAESGLSTYPSVAFMSVIAGFSIAGASSATLDVTSSQQGSTQFRCAVAVFVLSKSASASATYSSSEDGATLSTTIDFSTGVLFTAYYDEDDSTPILNGVANTIDEDMGTNSSDFFIGYSDESNAGSATHSIGYTSGAANGTAFGAVVYS